MAKQRVKIEGLQDFIRQIGMVPQQIGDGAKVRMNQFAEQVLRESREICPYNPKRKSGRHLRDSGFIRKAAVSKNPTVWFGYEEPHAWLVHENIAGYHRVKSASTQNAGPKYLEKPFLAHSEKLISDIEEIISQVMEKNSAT
jgi:hypothetical protein